MTVSASNINRRLQQSAATSAASAAYTAPVYPAPAAQPASALAVTSTDTTKATNTSSQLQPFLAKPKDSSAGSGHEASTDLLPITSPHLAIGASPTTTWQLLVGTYYYHQQALFSPLKDDVFLAPAIADNESVTTSSSETAHSASLVGNWVPTPCLSPVTSPSDFLCNHEPLFDGIEEDLQQQQHQQKEEKEQQQQQQSDHHHADYFSDDESQSTKSKPESVPTLDWCDEVSSPAMSFYGDDEQAIPEPQVPPEQFLFDDIEINSSDDEQQQQQEDDPFPTVLSRGIKRKHSKSMDNSDDQAGDDEESDGNERVQLPSSLAQLVEHRRPARAKPARRRTKRHAGRRARPAKPIYIDPTANEDATEDDGKYTIFERLTQAGIDWCRYCGTTEGVNWRPGPWGKRTLCK